MNMMIPYWTNTDPRDIFENNSSTDIVILRPGLDGHKSKKAGVGQVETHHSYSIWTSFEDHGFIGPDDKWDPTWWWIVGPS